MKLLNHTTHLFALVTFSLVLTIVGCTSDVEDPGPSDGEGPHFSYSDSVRSQPGSGKSADADTISVRTLETVSFSTFSAWTSRPDVHLRCSPRYRVIPGTIDEKIIDEFSSTPSLKQIPIRLVLDSGMQHLSVPIQDGLSQAISYSAGATLAMTISGMYRSKQICGRLTTTRTGSEAEEIFFGTWIGKDSVGVSLQKQGGSFMWGGVAAQSLAETTTTPSSNNKQPKDPEFTDARVLQTNGMWLFEINGNGSVALSQLLPVGEWKMRSGNFMYDDYPFVVEYTCDPYEERNDFCGFPSQDGKLMADPPSPGRVHFAMKVNSYGDSLIVKPVWQENAGGYILSHFTDLEVGGNIKLSISQ